MPPAAALLLLLVPAVATAAPANDECAAAIRVGALPVVQSLDALGATRDDAPVPCFDDHTDHADVWYLFTPPHDGTACVRIGGAVSSAAFHTLLPGCGGVPLPGGSPCSAPERRFAVTAGADAAAGQGRAVPERNRSDRGPGTHDRHGR